jgi:stage II sporulation protein D
VRARNRESYIVVNGPRWAFLAGLIAASYIWLALHPGQLILDHTSIVTIDSITQHGNKAIQEAKKPDIALPKRTQVPPQAAVPDQVDRVDPIIKVLMTKTGEIEKVSLEDYVRGVIAAEMPLSFEPAAMEAQALAARTYMIRRLWLNDRTGIDTPDADVTDTVVHQVYESREQLEQLKKDRPNDWNKLNDAVNATAGRIIVYGDLPIEALFFSTSNGFTENSEDVFPAKEPYLRSVASPWDRDLSPRAKDSIEMSLAEFYNKLGVKLNPVQARFQAQPDIRILERTVGQRVKWLQLGKFKLSGEEVRSKLGLRSAAFDWKISRNRIVLNTYGSGHGVGMSQWGAEGMAQKGSTAVQIVEHYYSGVRIEEVSKLAKDTGKRL